MYLRVGGPENVTDCVEFYWRPGCPFCIALRRRLRGSGLPVREVNIWDDPDAAARVRAVKRQRDVPTVFVGDHALVNPSIRQVTALVREAAPQLLADALARPRRKFRPLGFLSPLGHPAVPGPRRLALLLLGGGEFSHLIGRAALAPASARFSWASRAWPGRPSSPLLGGLDLRLL